MAEVPVLDRKINACLYRHDSPGARAILLPASLDAALCSLIRLTSAEDKMRALFERIERSANALCPFFIPPPQLVLNVRGRIAREPEANSFDRPTATRWVVSMLSRCNGDNRGRVFG